MKAAFHYTIKLKLIRIKANHEIEFVEVEEKVEKDNPIESREHAFDLYQKYVNAILANKGKNYVSDAQLRNDIKSFYNLGSNAKIQFGNKEIDFSNSIGNGIGIFFVIDKPSKDYIVEDHAGDEFLLHGIGGFGWADDPKSIITALTHEYWYYEQIKANIKSYKKIISFYEYDIAQAEPNIILETPFDWTGYNKPYSDKLLIPFTAEEQIVLDMLITKGESNQIEFKPSLLFNHKTGKGGISIKGIIAKTICGFLNTNGGILFIGITNKGELQGLTFDYSLSNGKNVKDFFQLEYDQMLEHFLSLSVKSNVSGQYYDIAGKDVFVVVVLPSKHRPIFLNGQEGKEFYVRTESSSRHMSDIEEVANYCIDTWTS